MTDHCTIKVNFKGGIISPGELLETLTFANNNGVKQISFGLRQQLLMEIEKGLYEKFAEAFSKLDLVFEKNLDNIPNIVSSYPAEEVFIHSSWLGEGVYKDILDELDHKPQLKINISDSNQSFTPLLTGNINWVAAPHTPHFWHLFVRLPKSNSIYEWDEMVYTNDVARLSKDIETLIYDHPETFIDNENTTGKELANLINKDQYNLKPIEGNLVLPAFNLPYYEGFNKQNNKYWLGVYKRSEMFSVPFLIDVCNLCLKTKLGQLCATPWKSIIIKGIGEAEKPLWSSLLDKYEMNMRHAANELNFQVQDDDLSARRLKQYIVQRFNDWDVRTFGICIGIKTKRKSEIFSSILIRRRPFFRLFGKEIFYVYDILCAKDFNPNERTERIFASHISKMHLASELHKCILWFYKNRNKQHSTSPKQQPIKQKGRIEEVVVLHQCPRCYSIYDIRFGEPDRNYPAGTTFEQLPSDYTCFVCETPKADFEAILEGTQPQAAV